jgi:hypothetical protein
MSNNYLIEKKAVEQAAKLAELTAKNKAAAKNHLLQVQLILARTFPKK